MWGFDLTYHHVKVRLLLVGVVLDAKLDDAFTTCGLGGSP